MRLLPLFLLLLAACASEPDQPGGLTADDQRELNEAAEMLDANSLAPETVSNESSAP
jgi:starvation-inducible outer membrane lipoprotein